MKAATSVFIAVSILLFAPPLRAHCDGLDGPVVKAAQKALETGNVNFVLAWVQKQDEAPIREAFQKARAVRKLGPEARTLADTYFFETLVRIHRQGEGAAYTGLKPAGRDLGPAIPAADKAVESGSAQALLKLLSGSIEHGLRERFEHVLAHKNFSSDSAEAGREFVKAYVEFLHYAEGIHQATKGPAHHEK